VYTLANLQSVPSAAPLARTMVREALTDLPESVVAPAVVMASTLVTNAVIHGTPPIELAIQIHHGVVKVAVTDRSHVRPVMPKDQSKSYGPGVQILDSLAEEWAVVRCADGKTTWFTVRIPEPSADGRSRG
jgi:anti-sigma regulatory factor (Ser/Thr protein kinase)